MGIGSADVGLIVATLDLQLVRLVRGAMAGSQRGAGGLPIGPGISPRNLRPRLRLDPEPLIEPRRRFEPTPRFEPRPVIHPEPRAVQPPCQPPREPEGPLRTKSPIEPPWKVLPWEMPTPPAPKIKIAIYRPDVVSKGSLIDFFI